MLDSLYVIAIITIWLSIVMTIVTLLGGVTFIFKHLKHTDIDSLPPLKRYPIVTVVVPAHNEELVIQDTIQAILRLNYPQDKLEVLLYADNCNDGTANEVRALMQQPEFKGRNLQVIERTGTGGKAGVLNDALKIAAGEYLGVYDADAAPETNALYFLVQKVLENPTRYAAAFGRNKTRNYQQNFLTRCINLEIVNTQRIQHTGLWQLFKIGRIPGTNFIINKAIVQSIGGWNNGALTEDTAISFSLMRAGKLIALAHRAEAFQQEPETLFAYYNQRKRWARGNYEVIMENAKHLFDRSSWRIKLEVFYYMCTFFWFNAAIVISNVIFIININLAALQTFFPHLHQLVSLSGELSTLFLINWILMFYLYLLQINIALASDYGQATVTNFIYAIVSYFTYAQLFIIVSVAAMYDIIRDKITGTRHTKWYKTQRF
ncbi:glycosyltransferase [Lactiplantibacillus mudanjiangensis]|uniref:Glycosyl transferase [Lactobacillus heilongjiangensis] n=1 Tax=Lactiplantibacillus mudanjiangensis TaxID=1296538 RepID=A0A660E9X9_9LACO|nr:glycosyltransferase family 2 protein [Lactiplantibacillus mudanjiangensis]VDG19068.1 glycosyl transferase [Lactobacillus heilongjiangensis] [Lactiplantibacillus mudanjiangensis]VDG23214.1 glycosyl transferase [Lactobacillus heilongjiangensis] [Lactiplantibacillus mudanjiangensis]VDG29860.1 glycosyl transferase [Lactobacillus heilongjiangensis] [Lactiplantibacillus mudanjiangensis]VDG33158.1 glycosyl transferase [Lactobacillus heilongjiangensis] [Lactiplantibacillus mudanjiangensis]